MLLAAKKRLWILGLATEEWRNEHKRQQFTFSYQCSQWIGVIKLLQGCNVQVSSVHCICIYEELNKSGVSSSLSIALRHLYSLIMRVEA